MGQVNGAQLALGHSVEELYTRELCEYKHQWQTPHSSSLVQSKPHSHYTLEYPLASLPQIVPGGLAASDGRLRTGDIIRRVGEL